MIDPHPDDPTPQPATTSQPTVVLWHGPDPTGQRCPNDAPAGLIAHFDWLTRLPSMAGRTSPDDRVLMAFRMDEPMVGLCAKVEHHRPIEVRALRLTDHRQLYLDYQGPLSGNRGVVHRVGRGTALWMCCESARFALQLHFENQACQVVGTCDYHAQDKNNPTGTWWKLILTPCSSCRAAASDPCVGSPRTR